MDTSDKTISTWTHKASFWLTFLLPIFLICFSIPLSGVSLNALKSSVLVIATSLALIFSLIDKINKKDLDVRISIGGLLGFVFCIIILLASFSSSTPILSLFGNGVEEPSGLTLISIVVFSFLFSRYHGNNINRFFSIFLFSYIFSTLFSVVFFVFPNFFSLTQGFNLFGGLNSFAIVSSFVLSLAILFFENKKENRLLSLVAILTSFFVLIFLNSRFCFILTAILIAFVFFKNFIFSKEIKFPGVSFLMLTIFIFFIFGKPIIGDFFPNIINLKSSEISPSFESSYLVLKDQLKESP
ncbi:MAG TPA: hypothetical protein PK886_02655, partial [Candidatus Paceibacterota bacterium]|nr:hypothetical protein [Candidatus Paceibacterota bacterium]